MRSSTKPRPSLPFPKLGTVADLAELMGVDQRRLGWHLDRGQRLGRRDLFFGCWRDKDTKEWTVPERVARRICGGWPLQHYAISEVAALTGFSEDYLRHRIVRVPPGVAIEDGRPPHAIGARLFFGTTLRIPESELRRLADGLIPGWPARQDQPEPAIAEP